MTQRPPVQSRGQPYERAGAVEGGRVLVEHAREGLEHVRYARRDVQGDVDIGRCGPNSGLGGVVEQHLVRPDLDQQRRKPHRSAKIGLTRGSAGSVPSR